MTRTGKIWLVAFAIYALFFAWYTSFGGPLSSDEIDHYMGILEAQEPRPTAERLTQMRRFMEEDTGDDFVMVNVIHMYDEPLQVAGVEPGESSEDVMAKYMDFMIPELLKRACHPVLYGSAASNALDLMNAEGMEQWSTGAGMRYRSRRDVLEISTDPAFRGSHDFKIAAMSKTIAFPIDPWIQGGDPRLVLGLVVSLLAMTASWRAALN